MKADDFFQKLENLSKPIVVSEEHKLHLKLRLMNAQHSSRWGYGLVLIPCLFLLGIFLKYYLNINLGIVDMLENEMASLDRNPLTKWMSPVLLVVFPLLGIAINLLSIMYLSYDKRTNELQINLKLRWPNLLIIVISLGVIAIFSAYLISENLRHLAQLYQDVKTH